MSTAAASTETPTTSLTHVLSLLDDLVDQRRRVLQVRVSIVGHLCWEMFPPEDGRKS
jgi:hypothetical protein